MTAPPVELGAEDAVGPRGRSRWRMAAQTLGFFVCLGLLWWCAAEALKQENREQLSRLGEARWWEVAGVIVLTLVSLGLNGSLFWVTLRPVHRLRWADVVAVNIVASLLALLPFKLSVLFRVLFHRTRDGVPLLTIGAWFSAVAVLLLMVIGPTGLVTALAVQAAAEETPAPSWVAWWPWLPLIAAGLGAAGMVVVCRILMDADQWRRIEGIAWLAPTEGLRRVVVGTFMPKAHEGIRMLGAPGAVGAAVVLRFADIGVQTARLLLAASIVGQGMSLELAVLAASVYFMIGVLAPTGALGVREAGTAGVFAVFQSEGFMVVVMTVTAAETVVLLGMGVAAAGWLRLDRMVRVRAGVAGRS